MNIFVLDTNPIIAASYHCDQHLHKMILESAQMLSTAAHKFFPHLKGHIYAPAYENHPCTVWVSECFANMVWVCDLANHLDNIRQANGNTRHSSMDVIQAILDNLSYEQVSYDYQRSITHFAEAMYPHIRVRSDLTTVQKYQLYYQKKHTQWLLTGKRGMTYKNRPVPDFMKEVIES